MADSLWKKRQTVKGCLKGCGWALLVMFVTCYAISKTDGWQRLNGSVLSDGVGSLTTTGVDSISWPEMSAELRRVSAMSGGDGYDLQMDGSHMQEGLAFHFLTRPSAGNAFAVTRDDTVPQRAGTARFVLMSGLNDDWGSSGHNGFDADSGRIAFQKGHGGLDASYVVYMTGKNPDTHAPGRIVARGTIHLP
jgi:hypothetical protein